jgi:hypothetical protein
MVEHVLRDQKLFMGGLDLTGFMNSITLNHGAEVQDRTAFLDTSRGRIAGLKSMDMQAQVFQDTGSAGPPESTMFSELGQDDIPTTVVPAGALAGNLAYFGLFSKASHQFLGSIGEVAQIQVDAQGDGNLVRGELLEVDTTQTATGTGTAEVIGTATAAQTVYAVLHVTAASGSTPTLIITIESDESGFGSPTLRFTFDTLAVVGSQLMTLAGPITPDNEYRVRWAITGGSPSFTFTVALGIL